MKGEDKIITKCSGILNWILDQENKCGKGSYWDNWPHRSKGNEYIKYCIAVQFPELDQCTVLVYKGVLRRWDGEVLGSKGSYCVAYSQQVLQKLYVC